MSEIRLRADEAREHASSIGQAAEEARGEFERMQGRLSALSESFAGQAAQAFDDRMLEWRRGADQVLESLGELSEWLGRAADTIETTDQELAGGLNG